MRNDLAEISPGFIAQFFMAYFFMALPSRTKIVTTISQKFLSLAIPMLEPNSWIARLSHIGTSLFTLFSGEPVGSDAFGNRYYRERKVPAGIRPKRWVVYRERPEASAVPPEWHSWLHYTSDAPLPEQGPLHPPWVKPHQPNLTFSDKAYLPPGHFLRGSQRDKATGDYQAWTPDSK